MKICTQGGKGEERLIFLSGSVITFGFSSERDTNRGHVTRNGGRVTRTAGVEAGPGHSRPHPHTLSLETRGTPLPLGAEPGGRQRAYKRGFLGS